MPWYVNAQSPSPIRRKHSLHALARRPLLISYVFLFLPSSWPRSEQEFWQLMRDSEALLSGAKALPPQFAVRFCRAGAPTSRQDPRLAGGVELAIALDTPCTAVWETTCMLLAGESLVAADKLV